MPILQLSFKQNFYISPEEKCVGEKNSKVILTGLTAAKHNWRYIAHLYNRKNKNNYTLSTYPVSMKSRKATAIQLQT